MQDTQRFSHDDPRLTAYALNELEGDERAAVEAALRYDPAARELVDEIRATAAKLGAAFADEIEAEAGSFERMAGGQPGVWAERRNLARAATVAGDDPRKLDGGRRPETGRGKLLKFPRLYYVTGLAAAACFAVIFVLRAPPEAGKVAPKKLLVTETEAKPAVPTEENAPEPARPLLALTKENEVVAPSVPVEAPVAAPAVEIVAEAKVETKAEPVAVATADDLAMPNPTVKVDFALGPTPAKDVAAPMAGGTEAGPAQSGTGSALAAAAMAPKPATPAARPTLAREVPAAIRFVPPTEETTATSTVLTAEGNARAQKTVAEGEVIKLSQFVVAADPRRDSVLKRIFAGLGPGRPAPMTRDEKLPPPPPPRGAMLADSEVYAYVRDNDFVRALAVPLSTFALDVDTASYANVRRFLHDHRRPPTDAVRIEELINYFPYRYPAPVGDALFATSFEVADAPWAPRHRLVRIGIKGREIAAAERPAANLVFLVDVSGSMNEPNKLPLVKESLRLLVGKLRADDRVAIVTYSGHAGLALPSTPVTKASEILGALEALDAGGATQGAMGIHLAYDIAKANFIEGGVNRVILCTDGDFNVGVTKPGDLVRLVEDKAKSGVFLTALGFGMGNLNDHTLELLADKGNGQYGYIDTRREAEKYFVEQLSSTLVTIAKDVKIQVDFNPAKVGSYRLIGYENRALKKEDFSNDKVDAGEIGAGHAVTALYEIVLVGADDVVERELPAVEESKYVNGAKQTVSAAGALAKELLTVRIRYKQPDGLFSHKLEFPLEETKETFAQATPDFRFAAAVAGFGMVLRNSPHKGAATMAHVIEWAEVAVGEDAGGYRAEFVELAREAERLVEVR